MLLKMLQKFTTSNIVVHFFRNHILDQICTTILDGENVDLSKMHLVFGLETDGSATEMRRAYKIKPEHLNCKVCSLANNFCR